MPSSSKNTAAPKDRRKAGAAVAAAANDSSGLSRIVTLKATPSKLRAALKISTAKVDTPSKDKALFAAATTLLAAANPTDGSSSDPNTPATGIHAAQDGMATPAADGPKKKGTKRSAATANGESRVRGKPGPKKKTKNEDGTIEGNRGTLGAHKLGPKANQGAINAGLRALDRSGKPCRKWTKGGFTLKSFTGVVWGIPRWTAPPKIKSESTPTTESATVSVEGSNKENKENDSQVPKIYSNSDSVDVEMQSAPSLHATNSPAPAPIVAI